MKIKQYQVDAFARRVFEGNPAAVCPLEAWLPDELMQAIAMENNLSETAFFVPEGDGYRLRWFTPLAEVDLCGHATLASAHVILNVLGEKKDRVDFETRSGKLTVTRDGDMLAMDFPAQPPKRVEIPETLVAFAATASLGAIWASCAPELGPRSVVDRLAQLEPAVLLMDEPFSALDALTAITLREELLDVWQAPGMSVRTIVMVTHIIEEAVELADRILVLSSHPGRLTADLKVNLGRPRDRRAESFNALTDKVFSLIEERA